MMEIYRPAFVAFVAILASGCQTASLEDAAPKPAAADSQAVSSVPGTMVDQADAEFCKRTGTDNPQEPAPEPAAPTVIRRNPGVMSVIPIEKTTPVEKKDFVATGARQTGQYPSFGRMPKAANSQLTEAQKLAAEAEMTELLRSRAATPGARAQYERRLKELRALAASHGSDTQRENREINLAFVLVWTQTLATWAHPSNLPAISGNSMEEFHKVRRLPPLCL